MPRLPICVICEMTGFIWRHMHSRYTTSSDTKATHLTLAMVLCGEPALLRWVDPDEHDIPKAKSGNMLENISVRFHLDERQ